MTRLPHQPSQNLPKRRINESPRDFGFQLGIVCSWWDNFCARQKVSENWKENVCIPQKSFEKLRMKLRPYIQKNKGFRNPIYVEKQFILPCR